MVTIKALLEEKFDNPKLSAQETSSAMFILLHLDQTGDSLGQRYHLP